MLPALAQASCHAFLVGEASGLPRERGALPYQLAPQRAVQPPSTRIVAPVISAAAGEARKTTTPATSLGLPIRPSTIRDNTSARNASSESARSEERRVGKECRSRW